MCWREGVKNHTSRNTKPCPLNINMPDPKFKKKGSFQFRIPTQLSQNETLASQSLPKRIGEYPCQSPLSWFGPRESQAIQPQIEHQILRRKFWLTLGDLVANCPLPSSLTWTQEASLHPHQGQKDKSLWTRQTLTWHLPKPCLLLFLSVKVFVVPAKNSQSMTNQNLMLMPLLSNLVPLAQACDGQSQGHGQPSSKYAMRGSAGHTQSLGLPRHLCGLWKVEGCICKIQIAPTSRSEHLEKDLGDEARMENCLVVCTSSRGNASYPEQASWSCPWEPLAHRTVEWAATFLHFGLVRVECCMPQS